MQEPLVDKDGTVLKHPMICGGKMRQQAAGASAGASSMLC
jgi:hypothetical protein